jgi:hypothetical protein
MIKDSLTEHTNIFYLAYFKVPRTLRKRFIQDVYSLYDDIRHVIYVSNKR